METNDPLEEFRRTLLAKNMSAKTVRTYGIHVRKYLRHVSNQKPTRQNAESFRASLLPLSASARKQADAALRSYFGYLVERGELLANPMDGLHSAKAKQLAQKPTLTPEEAKKILSVPPLDQPLGLRDRTILEVLYATAIRKSELLALNVYDVDLEEGFIWVRKGKGQRDRKVPLGKSATAWLRHYLRIGRPRIGKRRAANALFLSRHGNALNEDRLGDMIHACAARAGIPKNVTPHVFRHTAATEMVRNGAELRFVQEYLGHSHLATTQLYTRVTNPDLKEMVARCHPSSRARAKGIDWKAKFQAR